ncbi:MAG: FAD-binding oxidoreductase [Planctomycetales bacterium]
MGTAAFILGLVILGFVVLQSGLYFYSSLLEIRRQRDHLKFDQFLWWERIERAKLLREQSTSRPIAWNGFRKFVLIRKEIESEDVCSFYFAPHDQKPLPKFRPGQYLTFRIPTSVGASSSVLRCYSLSDAPVEEWYRVTVKRIRAPEDQPDLPSGLGSSYFHDYLREGDTLDVRAPNGHFVMDVSKKQPAVLLAGGIGITPFIGMLNALAQAGSQREVQLFYGVRDRTTHIMQEHLRRLERNCDNLEVTICCSQSLEDELQGRDYDHHGRITLDLLRSHLQTNNYEFFLCGPPSMMKEMTQVLKEWGVPKDVVRTEAFGAESVKARKEKRTPAQVETPQASHKITFARSGKEVVWDGTEANLLEFGVEHGVELKAACCAGGCGSCQVAVKSGTVVYDETPECEIEVGCCLTCVGRPAGNLVLDA